MVVLLLAGPGLLQALQNATHRAFCSERSEVTSQNPPQTPSVPARRAAPPTALRGVDASTPRRSATHDCPRRSLGKGLFEGPVQCLSLPGAPLRSPCAWRREQASQTHQTRLASMRTGGMGFGSHISQAGTMDGDGSY
ncbi:hypothetical protein T484DRAFT_1971129 [Baffinella frigidus]|nr:hypothetical protein T484DRAFT_1971129 [Cryptophyta sp. CCMP2293]